MIAILPYVILIFSIVCHEVAHGYVALFLGDPTAKNQGRLTLNPISHIDPVGSLLLPGLAFISGSSLLFGWAKPVPIQPHYFKNPKRGMMWVALAGPFINLVIASLAFTVFKLGIEQYYTWTFIQINLVLALFNLFPIPPLDGSRILVYFLPEKAQTFFNRIEPYGFLIIFGLAYLGLFSAILSSFLGIVLGWMVGL